MRTRLTAAIALVLAMALAAGASAQPFPSKPLHIVVPFPPGGAADITSRLLADQMSQGFGQPVIVDNRPGGSTIIGSEAVARAPADGYTLLVVFPSFVVNPALRRTPFDPLKDFRAVSQTISVPMAIAVTPGLSAKSLDELLALARAKPGEIAYGTPGSGTTHHIFGEMLKLAVRADFTHAPFQGEVPALNAVAGGHLGMAIVNASAVAPLAKSGKVRPIVVTTGERADVLPEVPSLREAGHPDLVATNWSGLVVPAGTPDAVVARLNAEVVRALRSPEVQDKMKALGIQPAPSTPETFQALLQSESARYGKVVREASIKAD